MRSPRISPLYAHTHNALLQYLKAENRPGATVPVQSELATRFGASRTTIHRILSAWKKAGLIGPVDGAIRLLRRPMQKDFLPQPVVLSRREEVEQSLTEMLIQGHLKPGQRFSELALARHHGVATGTMREALLHLGRLGVFTKAARKQWMIAPMDSAMINELMDLRILVETFALKRFFRNKTSPEVFGHIHAETRKLASAAHADRELFFRLDCEFHRTILESGRNRYLGEQFQFVSFPIQMQFLNHNFDYDLQKLGVSQHLALMDAIAAGDEGRALRELTQQLESAREVLMKLNFSVPPPV